jgi:transposase
MVFFSGISITDSNPLWYNSYFHIDHSHHITSLKQKEIIFLFTAPTTLLYHLMPDASRLRLNSWSINYRPSHLTLRLTSTPLRGRCPSCSRPSARVHSRYQRPLADLPWATFQVRLEVRVRKFFCDHAACHRRIFTERLPDIAQPWARRTLRLAQSLLAVGVALGGRAGSRLTKRLQRPTPSASLLRVIHNAPIPPTPTLNALGVDDWAWRRGHHYGTILVNLESHQVVDLLPDRSADSVAQWLAQHPGITVVSRDRSGLYAHGITQGAPHAVQVVDRFHLVSNLREALETFFLAQPQALKEAAANTARAMTSSGEAAPQVGMYRGRRHSPQNWLKRQQRKRQRRHAPRVKRYHQMHRLYDEGVTVTEIAQRLKTSRPTVYAHLRRGAPPEFKAHTMRSSDRVLAPYIPYLTQRWRDRGTDSMQLWREIQAQGYRHSSRTVSRFITELRRASDAGRPPEVEQSPYTRAQGPSARAVSFLVVRRPEKRSRLAQLYLEQLCQVEAKLAQLYELALSFLTLMRERRGENLAAWRTQATDSGIEPLARFAAGLQDDLAAIQAGLTLPWSNGVTEGHVNRLKLLKRQAYGRAYVALLRQRILQAS